MRAVLHAQVPPGVVLTGFDAKGRFVLPEQGRVWMGRAILCDIVVSGIVIGGRRNCCFETLGGWDVKLIHGGHALPIYVNGEAVQGERMLVDRDIIEPAAQTPASFRLVLRWMDL